MSQDTASQNVFSGIFHPTDLLPQGEVAFAHALKLGLEAKTRLNIVHVDRNLHENEDAQGLPGVREMLARWGVLPSGASRSDLHKTGLRVTKTLHLGSSTAMCVLDEFAREPADLVVLATHRRSGIDRFLHDEIAGRISRFSQTLTLFAPYGVQGFVDVNKGESRLRRILVPVDVAPWPQAAIDAAVAVAKVLSSSAVEFILVHVGDNDPQLSDLRLCKHAGWTWRTLVRSGNVVQEILSVADEESVDLIAMTTHGHNGFLDALRGNITERVLQSAKCPVLAAPAAAE